MTKKAIIPLIVLWVLAAVLIGLDVSGYWTPIEKLVAGPAASTTTASTTDGSSNSDNSGDTNAASDGSDSNTDNTTDTTTVVVATTPIGVQIITDIRNFHWAEFILTVLYSLILFGYKKMTDKAQLNNAIKLFSDERSALFQIHPPASIDGKWADCTSFWDVVHSYVEVTKADRLRGEGRHISFEIISRYHVNADGTSDTETGFYLGIPFFEAGDKKDRTNLNLQAAIQNQLATINPYIKVKRRRIGVKGSDPLAVLLDPVLPDAMGEFNSDAFALDSRETKQIEGESTSSSNKRQGTIAWIELEVQHRKAKDVGGIATTFPQDPLKNVVGQLITDSELPLSLVQIVIRGAEGEEKNRTANRIRALHEVEANSSGGGGKQAKRDNYTKTRAREERKRIDERNFIESNTFAITIRLGVCGTPEKVAEWRNMAVRVFNHYKGPGDDGAVIRVRSGRKATGADAETLIKRLPVIAIKERGNVTATELAALAHFPNAGLKVAGIRWAGSINLPPTPTSKYNQKADQWRRVYGLHEYANGTKVPIGHYVKDTQSHAYILGPSGVGKSELLRNLSYQHISQNHTVVIFEPHQDVIPRVSLTIPHWRTRYLVVIRLTNPDYSASMNVLEISPDTNVSRREAISNIVSDMMGSNGVFATIMGANWESAPQMQTVLNSGMQLLMEAHPKPTLWGLYLVLNDESFRNKLLATGKLRDPIALNFWQNEFAKLSDTEKVKVVGPANRRIGAFLRNPLARHLVSQPNSTFNLRKLIDDRKGRIICFDVAKTKLGSELTQFTGVLFFAKYKRVLYSRSSMDEDKRHNGIVVADEFQNFATKDFADFFGEARKFRHGAIVAHQNRKQLPDWLLEAIVENASTKVIFRQGNDASFFAPIIRPASIEVEDMVSSIRDQEAYHAYVRMLVKNTPQDTCLIETLPPQKPPVENFPPSSYYLEPDTFVGNTEGWLAPGLIENVCYQLEEQGWNYLEECIYRLTNTETNHSQQIAEETFEALIGYVPEEAAISREATIDYLYDLLEDKARFEDGFNLVWEVEYDRTDLYDRQDYLLELSESEYQLYRLCRRLRNVALRELIYEEPALIPYALTRIHLINDLFYYVPRWEIEAEFSRAASGDSFMDAPVTRQEIQEIRESVQLDTALVAQEVADDDPPIGDSPTEYTFGESGEETTPPPTSKGKGGKGRKSAKPKK